MKQPWCTPEEKKALGRFFTTKSALNRHIRACAAVHDEQWQETRRVNVVIEPLPHDFLKAAIYWKATGTATKRRIRREVRKANRSPRP